MEFISGKGLQLASAVVVAMMLWPAGPASAQGTFQCSGGPNEQQVGVTMQGPVTVPICVSRPAPRSGSAEGGSDGGEGGFDPLGGVYIGGRLPEPPRGWRPTYGGFMSFVVSQEENGDNPVHDMVLTLGHATPQEAAAAATTLCMERALFPEPSASCHPQIIDRPYFVVLQRDTEDGRYQMLQFNDPQGWTDHFVRRDSGRVEACSEHDAPTYPRPCFRLVVFDRNGIWPR
ncbi:hypothetical protein [Brevundimonas sp. AAP58]|uniref:hypothetical protein n=1 Tax=Brevundimonas sp. AAP58 TaxID=1523422 RepID=UPI000B3242EB|nr:hypothetical protein [Brevundimonas sp. AAP58]